MPDETQLQLQGWSVDARTGTDLSMPEPEGQDSDISGPSDVVTRAVRLRAVQKDAREAQFVFSTDSIDRHGDRVEQVWQLDNFYKDPVALWAHNSRELPIGYAKDVGVVDGQLRGTIVFASVKANPRAEEVWNSIQEGTLRAVSVGFIPHSSRIEKEDDQEILVLSDNELVEISVVPVPANVDALMRMRQLALAVRDADGVRTSEWVDCGAVPYSPYKPVATGKWDARAAEARIRRWATKEDNGIDWAKYRKAFAWYDSAKPSAFTSYKLPHHDVKAGGLVTMRAGVIAAGNAVQGGRGGVKLPAGDVSAVKSHLGKHYKQFDMVPPWDKIAPPPDERGGDSNQQETDMDLEKEVAALKATLAERDNELAQFKADQATRDEETQAAAAQHVQDLTARTEKAEADVVSAKERIAALEQARTEQQERADKASAELCRRDLADLVGRKILPTEEAGLVKLHATNRELYDEQFEAIKARPDMVLTDKDSTVGADPLPEPKPAGSGDNDASPADEKIHQAVLRRAAC
jgi:HK97 family phage prohead protease